MMASDEQASIVAAWFSFSLALLRSARYPVLEIVADDSNCCARGLGETDN